MTRSTRAFATRLAGWLLTAMLLGAGPAAAADDAASADGDAKKPSINLRAGTHETFGRVVFNAPANVKPTTTRDGDDVTVRFEPPLPVRPPNMVPRNVRSLAGGDGQSRFTVVHGAVLRPAWINGAFVIDVLNPPAPLSTPPPASTPATPTAPRAQSPGPLAAMTEHHALIPPKPEPAAEPPRMAEAPQPPAVASVLVPSEPDAGAAAFRRGDTGFVVIGRRAVIDAAALAGGGLGDSAVTPLADATLVRVPLKPEETLSLTRGKAGWTITRGHETAPSQPITAVPDSERLLLQASSPAQVVTVPDEAQGTVLLVGTQMTAGEAVAAERVSPEFRLLPTWQGVAVEPVADTLALHGTASGFMLTGRDGLALSLPADASAQSRAAALTRRFDIPVDDDASLMRRLAAQLRTAAVAAPLARGPARLAAARTMIAVGMGAEAQALLRLAARADPHLAADPDTAALEAMAALLAGRVEEADALAAPALAGGDDVLLWRGVRAALRAGADEHGSTEAAADFAQAWPLALAYPAPLRARLMPLIAETLIASGKPQDAKAVVEQGGLHPGLDFASAMLVQAGGDTDQALAAYRALAESTDRRVASRAAAKAVELELSAGRIDAAHAADALDKQQLAWRGDAREMLGRVRVAALRQQAGQWRAAMAVLRDAQARFPDAEEPERALRTTFASLLGSDLSAVPPLDFVAMANENADLIPPAEAGAALSLQLADRLMALDLPSRAAPLVDRLMRASPTGARRSMLGTRLARMRLADGDAAGALAALSDSATDGEAPDEARALTAAEADMKQGRPSLALAALAPLGSPAVLAARASVLEQTRDWPGATETLSALAAATVPADGALDETAGAVAVRLASAAAQGGDSARLSALRERYGGRMPAGRLADTFNVLTAAPVAAVSDLPRARREIEAARGVAGR